MAIAGEGRIGAIESAVLPLNDGPAYFALRSRVPLVPIAINGTSWLRFGGRVRVRVGEPIVGSGRPDRANIAAMTAAPRRRSRRSSPMLSNPPGAAVPGRGCPSASTTGRRAPARRPWPPRLAGADRAAAAGGGGRLDRASLAYSARRIPHRSDRGCDRPVRRPHRVPSPPRRADRRADRPLGAGDDARRRQASRRAPRARRPASRRPAHRNAISNGCSLPAMGRRP